MSILYPYAVIDLDPSFQKVHTNYELIHWQGLAGQTAVGGMTGYFFYWLKTQGTQVTRKVPRYHVFGALAGLCLGVSNNHYTITNQFQGYFPNDNLIKKYGALSDQQIIAGLKKEGESMKPLKPFTVPRWLSSLTNSSTTNSTSSPPNSTSTSIENETNTSDKPKNSYPMISLFPTSNTIILNFEQWDFVRMFGCGLAFFVNAILITKFMRGHNAGALNSMSQETIHSFLFFQGVLMGAVTEYNTSHLRLLGLAPNESEVKKHGKLNERKLMKEILVNKYPVVNFDEINIEEVRFNDQTLQLIQLAISSKYPYTDLSEIRFQNLYQHSSKQNELVIDLITKAGYPHPTYF